VRGFLLVLGLLCLASTLAVPNWPIEMIAAIRRTPPPTAYSPSIGATWLAVLETMHQSGWSLWALYATAAGPLIAIVVPLALNELGVTFYWIPMMFTAASLTACRPYSSPRSIREPTLGRGSSALVSTIGGACGGGYNRLSTKVDNRPGDHGQRRETRSRPPTKNPRIR
jgi:hypothetical protein